jgi:hypothetical protein
LLLHGDEPADQIVARFHSPRVRYFCQVGGQGVPRGPDTLQDVIWHDGFNGIGQMGCPYLESIAILGRYAEQLSDHCYREWMSEPGHQLNLAVGSSTIQELIDDCNDALP